jgi:hypothetical protein
VGRYFKRLGKRVVTSDLLRGHAALATALVENNRVVVPPQLLQAWLTVIKDPAVATRFAPWAPRFFTPEEAIWLGVWRAHLASPELEPTVRAMGQATVYHVMGYWLSFKQGDERQDKPMSPSVAFQHYLQTVNTWVCNNGLANQALCGDAHSLTASVEADLLFCYPPTDQGFLGYPDHPTLFEGWMRGDPHHVLPGLDEEAPEPTLGTPIGEPRAYAQALRRFLASSGHFPLWALAFNDRYPLEEAAMAALVKEFRPVVRHASFKIAGSPPFAPPVEKLLIARAT